MPDKRRLVMVKAETLKNYTKQQLEDLNKDSLIDLYLIDGNCRPSWRLT